MALNRVHTTHHTAIPVQTYILIHGHVCSHLTHVHGRIYSMQAQNPRQHTHTYCTHTNTPAGLLGIETIQDGVPGAPSRNWSYVAAPGSRTYTNTNEHNQVSG